MSASWWLTSVTSQLLRALVRPADEWWHGRVSPVRLAGPAKTQQRLQFCSGGGGGGGGGYGGGRITR